MNDDVAKVIVTFDIHTLPVTLAAIRETVERFEEALARNNKGRSREFMRKAYEQALKAQELLSTAYNELEMPP